MGQVANESMDVLHHPWRLTMVNNWMKHAYGSLIGLQYDLTMAKRGQVIKEYLAEQGIAAA